MLLVKNAVLAAVLAIVFAPSAVGQTITYDTGLNRIESVKNLLVNGTIYDVTTSYGIPINGASLGPGDIPDADIAAAIAAIVGLPDVGSLSGDPTSFLYIGAQSQSGLAADDYQTLGVIRRVPSAPSNNGTSGPDFADNVGSPSAGIASFAAVPAPEPTTFALAAGLSLLGLYSHRRRRRLMERSRKRQTA